MAGLFDREKYCIVSPNESSELDATDDE